MIRTAFINIDDVAKDCKVKPEYILNWMSQQIGAKSWYTPDKPERERGSISGEYNEEYLNQYFETFLRKFVLCKSCKLPEYTYVPLKKGKDVGIKCRSCGWKGLLASLELPQKFHKYILNHPPEKSVGEGEDNRRAQAAKEKKKEEKRMIRAAEKIDDSELAADDDWATDTSAAAAAARAAELVAGSDALKGMVEMEDDELSSNSLAHRRSGATALASLMEEGDVTDSTSYKEAVTDAFLTKHSLTSSPQVAIEIFLGSVVLSVHGVKAGSALKRYRDVAAALVAGAPRGQDVALNALSFARDLLAEGDERAKFVKKFPVLLKALYDLDLVEEEAFLRWAEAETSPEDLVDSADPFISWLQNAEEESEE
jgi:translation initiation factor 5